MPCETFLSFLSYSQNKMYYSDFVENRIYSASLDTGGDVEVLLDDNVEVPGKTGGASSLHNYKKNFYKYRLHNYCVRV